MFFLYVDSSGQTKMNRNSHDSKLYILSGVIVPEKDWKTIEENITTLKKKIFPDLNPERWELHAYEIWNSEGFFANKSMRINFAKKQRIFSNVIDLICNSEITLINVVIFKNKMQDWHIMDSPLKQSWTFLVKNFEHFLKLQQNKFNNGLIISDSSQKVPESEISEAVQKLTMNGPLQCAKHVIECPIFMESRLHNLIQLADMIAYIISKHYRCDTQFKNWFERLKLKMYQPNGKLHELGIKEFP